jgi:hypothetical protein
MTTSHFFITAAVLAGIGMTNLPASAACTNAPAGLVGWWKAENNADDTLGNHNGLLAGGLGFGPGKVGQAFNFTAAGQEVQVPASASINVGTGGGYTTEGWINPLNVATQNPIFEWNDGVTAGAHLWIAASVGGFGGPGSLYASLIAGTTDTTVATGPGVISAGIWQHVAFTYDRATGIGRLYLNGTEVASRALGDITAQTALPLRIGRRPNYGAETFAGKIDELSLYNRALSSAELRAIYNAGTAGKCPPLLNPFNVYDNSLDDLNRTYGPNGVEFGNQITLTGTNRFITDFKFEYFLSGNASGGETLQLKFFKNDGPCLIAVLTNNSTKQVQTPGTVFYTSPVLNLQAGFQTAEASQLSVQAPDTFTWAVSFQGIDAGEVAGLRLYSPPTVGTSFAEFWQENNGFWNAYIFNDPAGPSDFAARVTAVGSGTNTGTSIITTMPGTIRGVPPPSPPTPVGEPTPYSSSCLTIINPRLVGHTFSVLVSTFAGRNYTLEYNTSLTDTNWTAVQTLPGTGSTITLTDSTATNPARFYRVRFPLF